MRYDVCLEIAPAAEASGRSIDSGVSQVPSWAAEETKRVCLVRAWAPALPGCFCEAPSEGEALVRMPAAIGEYLAWLRCHGEDVSQDGSYEVEIIERVETPPGRSEPCFDADRVPASEEDIETAIRRMGYARDDLLALVSPLPDVVLDWQPAPEKWSIRQILAHIASADGYYRTSLLAKQPTPTPNDERFDLALQRERAIAHLRSLTTELRAKVYRPNWAWREDEDEEWPVRKALRRFIYHERFHTRDIQQTLAWLLTGGPDFRREEPEAAATFRSPRAAEQ